MSAYTKEVIAVLVAQANELQIANVEALRENTVAPESVADAIEMTVIEDGKKLAVSCPVQVFSNDMLPDVAATVGVTVPSLRSKLSNLGLYKKNDTSNKPATNPNKLTRIQRVTAIEKASGIDNLATLAKASVQNLTDLQSFFEQYEKDMNELEELRAS